jgi:hypothetical protein
MAGWMSFLARAKHLLTWPRNRTLSINRKLHLKAMSDSEGEERVVQLLAIPTLTELYKKSQLKAPSNDIRYKVNASLLDRICL